jgi:hypothetical protein
MRTGDHNSSSKSVLSPYELEKCFVFVKFRRGNTVFRQALRKRCVRARVSYLRTISFTKTVQRQRQVNGTWIRHVGGMTQVREESKNSKKITALLSLCAPQIPHKPACNWNRILMVRVSWYREGTHTTSISLNFSKLSQGRRMLGRRQGYELFLP